PCGTYSINSVSMRSSPSRIVKISPSRPSKSVAAIDPDTSGGARDRDVADGEPRRLPAVHRLGVHVRVGRHLPAVLPDGHRVARRPLGGGEHDVDVACVDELERPEGRGGGRGGVPQRASRSGRDRGGRAGPLHEGAPIDPVTHPWPPSTGSWRRYPSDR